MATVYLSLGSNLGNRALSIYAALRRLRQGITLEEISSLYETEPVGLKDQPWFLNLVCRGETALSPEALLDLAKEVEQRLGRKETIRFGPRIIDIDILLYDDLLLDTPHLQIPHPRLHERAFVLVPLAELAPDLVHPGFKTSVREIQEQAPSMQKIRLYPLTDERASD
jgi:2-amino-4-hydroxy-6-hydroxymethyldihydropteridine diphosphokinase